MDSLVPLLIGGAAAAVIGVRGSRRRVAADPSSARAARAAARRGAAGLVVVLLALATPLESLAHASFAWHMAQHQLLLLVAAPLMASAAPLTTLRYAIGGPSRGSGTATAGSGVGVVLAGVLAVATLFAWHVPGAYDAALASAPIHRLEHASLLVTATLLWGAVLAAARDDRVLIAVIVLAGAAITGAALGVVLLTSGAPLYAHTVSEGVSALDQQRLGGAMMKVGALLVYAGAAVWLFVRWMGRLEAEDVRRPRAEAAGTREP